MSTRYLPQADKLADVHYEIRGEVLATAEQLERAWKTILKLNTGNTALFDFPVPPAILDYLTKVLPESQGYSPAKGLVQVRQVIADYYQQHKNYPPLSADEVILGNGVSELINITLQALLNPGDEVLIPQPDYPLWTAATKISGGNPVHYRCDEQADWFPDVADIESKITAKTKALVIINPNNPTGAVYSADLLQQLVDLAVKHSLLLLVDEIYERLVFDNIPFTSLATLAPPELLCITFNGLSKTYRIPGFRAGWMIISGDKSNAKGFLAGVDLLASTRLCANVPAQQAIIPAILEDNSIAELIAKDGRLTKQRDLLWSGLNNIPGIVCTKPQGALYAFPKLDLAYYSKVKDDKQLVLSLLKEEQILVVQGSGFNFPTPDHLRFVILPQEDELKMALVKLARFLARQT